MTVIGFPSLFCCLLAEALLSMKYLGSDNKTGNAACILFMFLYIIFFQVSGLPIMSVHSNKSAFTVLRCAGLHLGGRGFPNADPCKRFESRHILHIHGSDNLHSAIWVGLQEPVSDSRSPNCDEDI